MNWCPPHWNELRAAIEARGLSKFVAPSGQAAMQNVEAELAGEEPAFDPLMGSWARINSYMLQSPALRGRVMQCPCCILVEDGQPHLVQNWINGCTDDALKYAVEQGLVPTQ